MTSSHADLFHALLDSSDEEKVISISLLDNLKSDFAEILLLLEKLSLLTDNQLLALLDIQFLEANPGKLSPNLQDLYMVLQLQEVAFDQCVLALEAFKKITDLFYDEISGAQLITHCKLNRYLSRIDSKKYYKTGSTTAEDIIIAGIILWPTENPLSPTLNTFINRLTNRDGILTHSLYTSTMLDFSCVSLKSITEMLPLAEEFKSNTAYPIVLALRELGNTTCEASAEEKTPACALDIAKTETAWLTAKKLDFFWHLPQSDQCDVQLSKYFIYLIDALKNNDMQTILLLLMQIGELTLANKLSAPYIKSQEVLRLLTTFTPNLTQFSEIEFTLTSGSVTSTNAKYFSALKSGITVFQRIARIEKQKMDEYKASPTILNILITDLIPNSSIRTTINTLLEKIRNHAHKKLTGERQKQIFSLAEKLQFIVYCYYKNPQKNPSVLVEFQTKTTALIATMHAHYLHIHRIQWKNGRIGEFFKVAMPTSYTDFLAIAELIKNEKLGMKQYVDFATLRTNKSSPHLT